MEAGELYQYFLNIFLLLQCVNPHEIQPQHLQQVTSHLRYGPDYQQHIALADQQQMALAEQQQMALADQDDLQSAEELHRRQTAGFLRL